MEDYILQVVFLLFVGHFIADYPLQGDFLAKAKNWKTPIPGIRWTHAMTAHCTIHAGFVFIITGMPLLALIEFVVHFATDYAKCSEWIDFDTDQAIHLLTKTFLCFIMLLMI